MAHLSEIVTADMQMLCNIFQILSLQQMMKEASFVQFLVLKKKNVFFIIIFLPYMGMTVNEAWTIQTNPQSLFNNRIDMEFGENWQSSFRGVVAGVTVYLVPRCILSPGTRYHVVSCPHLGYFVIGDKITWLQYLVLGDKLP